jgi:glyoxylase-like metal-dependent hydrolase (beta-lactamase superfamily II)
VRPAHLHHIHPRITLCQTFDPTVKTDLFSTAITVADQLFLIDPIDLPEVQLGELCHNAPVAGIVVTNANHPRASLQLSERLSAPIFARENAFADTKPISPIKPGDSIGNALEVIQVEGAVEGEIALYESGDGGTLILGDALINLDPYGLTFLPRKYCLDQKRMRRSLRQLLDKSAERILFAHGTPILSRASFCLRELLAGS